eukprot:5237063-Amphidinium_carterae.1
MLSLLPTLLHDVNCVFDVPFEQRRPHLQPNTVPVTWPVPRFVSPMSFESIAGIGLHMLHVQRARALLQN